MTQLGAIHIEIILQITKHETAYLLMHFLYLPHPPFSFSFFRNVRNVLEILEMFRNVFIHSFSTAYPVRGCGGAGAYLSIFGRSWGNTSCQLIAELTYRDKQPSQLTFTPMGNL